MENRDGSQNGFQSSVQIGKVVRLLVFSLAGILAYVALFALKRRFFPAEFVLTEGVWTAVIFLPCFVAVLFLFRKTLAAPPFFAVAVFLITFLSIACFNLSVPAIFDRSVTVYMLNIFDGAGDEGMTENDVRSEFLAVYFGRSRAINRRLREQVHGGNLSYDGSRYRITGRGEATVSLARRISRIFLLDPSIVEKRK